MREGSCARASCKSSCAISYLGKVLALDLMKKISVRSTTSTPPTKWVAPCDTGMGEAALTERREQIFGFLAAGSLEGDSAS